MAYATYKYKIIKNGEHIHTAYDIPHICTYLNEEVYQNDFYTKYMIMNHIHRKDAKHQHGFKNLQIVRETRQ